MSETVEDHATSAAPAPEETADQSKPKFVKKPVKPDEVEYKKQMDALGEQITIHRARMDEIQRLLSGRRINNETPEMKTLKNKLNTLRAEWQTTLDVKKAARTELDNISKSRDAVRAQIRSMRDRMKVTTVEKIDEEISQLERHMQQSSMSLAEEKATMEQIKQLKSSRTSVAEYNQKLTQLSQDDAVKDGVMQRIKAADDKLTTIKTEQDAIRSQLEDLRAKETAATADIPALQEERVSAKAVIDAAYAKKSELYADFKARMDAWREEEKLWRAQRDEDRKRRQEQRQKEYEDRQAARKAQEAELAGEPFQREIDDCDQLTAYLGQYVIKEQSADADAAADTKTEAGSIDGYKLLGRKKEQEDDPFFLGTGGKKNKKKGKAKKSLLEEEDAIERVLVHSVDIINCFSRMKLELPLTVGDVPASLNALKDKKTYYQERQRKKKAGEEDPDDAADAAAAAEEQKPAKRAGAKPAKTPLLSDSFFPALGASGATAAPAVNGTSGHAEDEDEDGEPAEDAADGAAADAADENAVPSSQNKVAKSVGEDVKVKLTAAEGATAVAVNFEVET